MSLRSQKFLFIDCQTTGTSPTNGQIIDLAWSFASADEVEPIIHSCLIALPEGRTLPAITTEITGLNEADMASALPAEDVKRKFKLAIQEAGFALIHYSQFEKPYLKAFLLEDEGDEIPFEIFCTSRLAKKLVPSLPNFNIRGVAGFYGMPFHELKRAGDHVRATILIWKGLIDVLEKNEQASLDHMRTILGDKTKTPKAKFEFRITKEFRLGLPDRPGIYRMKDKAGNVLYVGKATSLFDRVNSYFRGQTGRDKRKLQMLAQTWEMETQEARSALEAAVIESDEIKRLDPPYNVSLKSGRRELAFYNRDFDSVALEADELHPLGPFSVSNSIEELRWLMEWRANEGLITRIFYGQYEQGELEAGYKVFLSRHPLNFEDLSLRSQIAFGYRLWRKHLATIDDEEVVEEEIVATEDEEKTPDDFADKFERLYMRAAQILHRAHALTRLLNANVGWDENGTHHELAIRNGQIISAEKSASEKLKNSWTELSLADYDRMSVLYSEIKNRGGNIQFN